MARKKEEQKVVLSQKVENVDLKELLNSPIMFCPKCKEKMQLTGAGPMNNKDFHCVKCNINITKVV